MIPYVAYFLSCLLILTVKRCSQSKTGTVLVHRGKNVFDGALLIYSCLFFIVIIGCRDFSIGPDTQNYFNNIYNNSYPFETIFSDWKYAGSRLVYKLLKTMFPSSYHLTLIFVAAITMIAVCRFLKKNSVDYFFSFVLLLSLGFIYSYMYLMKQTLATIVLLLSVEDIKSKRLFPFIIKVLVASLLHPSAIVFILAWCVRKIKPGRKSIIIVPALSLITIICRNYIFRLIKYVSGSLLSSYEQGDSSLNYTGLLIQMMILLASVVMMWREIDKDEKGNFYVSVYSIGILFQSMTQTLGEFFRISKYFSIFGVLLLPYAYKSFRKSQPKIAPFVYASMILVFILYFLFFSGREKTFYPYLFYSE